MFGVSHAPPKSAAVCDAPRSLTGKMKAIEPGVCPGTATGVTVRSPSVICWPSTMSASCFGIAAGGPAGPRPPRAGGGFSISIQSAADTYTFDPNFS